jgi:hypothetical protein
LLLLALVVFIEIREDREEKENLKEKGWIL